MGFPRRRASKTAGPDLVTSRPGTATARSAFTSVALRATQHRLELSTPRRT